MYLKCSVVWLLIWIGICQCRKKQTKIKNKVANITKAATSFNKLKLLTFHSTPANPGSAHPQY